jgi:hypothetical protein
VSPRDSYGNKQTNASQPLRIAPIPEGLDGSPRSPRGLSHSGRAPRRAAVQTVLQKRGGLSRTSLYPRADDGVSDKVEKWFAKEFEDPAVNPIRKAISGKRLSPDRGTY